MRETTIQLDDFSGGSGYNSRRSQHLDTGSIYDTIYLPTTNINADQLTMKLSIEGDVKFDITGTDLEMLEAYRGITQIAGTYVMRFADILARTQEGRDFTAFVTNAGENIVLTAEIGAATTAQNTNGDVPTIDAWADMRAGLKDKGGALIKRAIDYRVYRDDIAADKTGDIKFSSFVRGPRIRAMHFDSAAVTDLEIKRDKVTRYQATKAINDMRLQQIGNRVPQSGFFHFDPIVDNYAKANLLQTEGRSFEVIPTVNATGAIPVLFETVGFAQ